jgi:hypothetical protein
MQLSTMPMPFGKVNFQPDKDPGSCKKAAVQGLKQGSCYVPKSVQVLCAKVEGIQGPRLLINAIERCVDVHNSLPAGLGSAFGSASCKQEPA